MIRAISIFTCSNNNLFYSNKNFVLRYRDGKRTETRIGIFLHSTIWKDICITHSCYHVPTHVIASRYKPQCCSARTCVHVQNSMHNMCTEKSNWTLSLLNVRAINCEQTLLGNGRVENLTNTINQESFVLTL